MNKQWLFSYALWASSFLSFPLAAECVSTPDCADLGYDKTSCPSGDGVLKCPFDISKVKCLGNTAKTCEAIGKKTCNNWCIAPENCCTNSDCTSGKVCDNYVCKEVICAVGDIYYSDKTCSSTYNSSKKAIGVVGKISNGGKNGIVVEKNHSSSTIPWGCNGKDLSCITNISGDDSSYNSKLKADYNGKANTDCMATNNCGVGTAGSYCKKRSVEGVTGWYLPAGGELYDTMITNGPIVNAGLGKISGTTQIPTSEQDYFYWSSSEFKDIYAWPWQFGKNRWYYRGKTDTNYVRCVLAF